MGWRRSGARAGRLAWCAVAALLLVAPAAAQVAPGSILTLDQDRFFVGSAFGQAAIERERVATDALEKENKRIEAELVAEELALTEQRKTLPPEEFTARADAFDAKVEAIRKNQDAKAQVLSEARDEDRKQFLQVAAPILGELLKEKQAVAIIDKGLLVISLSAIDVTDEAIARVDAAMAQKPDEPAAP